VQARVLVPLVLALNCSCACVPVCKHVHLFWRSTVFASTCTCYPCFCTALLVRSRVRVCKHVRLFWRSTGISEVQWLMCEHVHLFPLFLRSTVRASTCARVQARALVLAQHECYYHNHCPPTRELAMEAWSQKLQPVLLMESLSYFIK
jgi:hypothetical protein